MKVSVACTTDAPPDVAYATNIDIARWPDFVKGITKVEILSPEPVREGTRFRETRMMYGREATEEMTVTELRPPHRQVFTAESHGARYVATTEFAPAGSGTQMTLTFEGIPVSFAAKLMTPLMRMLGDSVKKKLQADLDDVAKEAARRSRSA